MPRARKYLGLANVIGGMIFHALLSLALFLIILIPLIRSFGGDLSTAAESKANTQRLLTGLKYNLGSRDGATRMQAIFPEGACFTWTLYGMANANLAEQETTGSKKRQAAMAEVETALEGQCSAVSIEPFRDTQVRRGVFWLGQRNYLLGRSLELQELSQRREDHVIEFHQNSAQLYDAFTSSPTHHLDSYEGMCWPADNMTALASLAIHDDIYQTNYRRAFHQWADWTTSHPCKPQAFPPDIWIRAPEDLSSPPAVQPIPG